ncbi:hypothetical protein ABPG72_016480 [Tetrahymena utriculariae]
MISFYNTNSLFIDFYEEKKKNIYFRDYNSKTINSDHNYLQYYSNQFLYINTKQYNYLLFNGNSSDKDKHQLRLEQSQPLSKQINSYVECQKLIGYKDMHNQIIDLDLLFGGLELNVLKLSLSSSKTADNRNRLVSEFLKCYSQKEQLSIDLTNNSLGGNSATYLSQALKSLSLFNQLTLWPSDNNLTNNRAKSIAESLYIQELLTLKFIYGSLYLQYRRNSRNSMQMKIKLGDQTKEQIRHVIASIKSARLQVQSLPI